jgi:hypothetical protein
MTAEISGLAGDIEYSPIDVFFTRPMDTPYSEIVPY